MHDFYVNIKQGGMMGEAGMNPVLRHLAKDMMFRSWFVTRLMVVATKSALQGRDPGREKVGRIWCTPSSWGGC